MGAAAREGMETTQLASPTPSTPSVADRWTGTDLDHFHVVRPLGRGGMGAVYLAHDTSLDRPVAIKVLPDHVLGHPELEERFLHEARAQAKLASPNVVALHYIGRLPARDGQRGGLYFAMEWVDGEPLESILEKRSLLDPEEARKAMIHVARGLRDANRAGIIHRDIKPSNLLRDRDGWVKIADFGIAKVQNPAVRPGADSATSGERKSLTQDGVVLGTPLYMAPEQAAGEKIDFRADMYALGCTFYHLIAGVPPFDGNSGVVIAAKHMAEKPEPIGERVKDVPRALAAVIDRLMAKKPDERFASYDALLEALEGAAPERVAYAGFWARGAANAIDCLLAGTMVAFLGWIGAAVHLVYVTLAHAFFGKTIAKWMLSMRVVHKSGAPLGLVRSAVRTVSSLWLPFFVGVVTLLTQGASHLRHVVERLQPKEAAEAKSIVIAMAISHGILTLLWLGGILYAAFDPERRAFHDLLVSSRVVYELRRIARARTSKV